MGNKAQEFYRLYGPVSLQKLQDQIITALAEKNDTLALELNDLLLSVERFIYGDLPSDPWEYRTEH